MDDVRMTLEAGQWVEETGTSVGDDLDALRTGELDRDSLTLLCMAGADDDRHQAIKDYVSAVVLHVGG